MRATPRGPSRRRARPSSFPPASIGGIIDGAAFSPESPTNGRGSVHMSLSPSRLVALLAGALVVLAACSDNLVQSSDASSPPDDAATTTEAEELTPTPIRAEPPSEVLR